MKRIYFKKQQMPNILMLVCMLFALASCSEKDIDSFDKNSSYIYFDVPYVMAPDGTESEYREDSISYSFALDPEEVRDTTIKVVVKVIGMAADYDRPYNIEIITDKTTATSAEWNPDIVSNRSIKAGELTDTIRIDVQRTEALQDKWEQICLRLLPNDNFAIGYYNLEEVKVSFSDILAKPDWWDTWMGWGYMGNYYPEVYRKWIEIYYLGADPNTYNGEPMYWDNMPPYPEEWNYPVLFMYYQQLKAYFDENEVYPNGDTSLPAIKIP